MAKSAQRNVSGFGIAAVGLFRMLAGSCPDLRQHLVGEQFDRLEERRVRHAAHVHLDDIPRMAEKLVQVENAVGDLVRAGGATPYATLTVPNTVSVWTYRTPSPPTKDTVTKTRHT